MKEYLDIDEVEKSVQDVLIRFSQLRFKHRNDMKLVGDGVGLFLIKHVKEGPYPWSVQKFAMNFAVENTLREEKERNITSPWGNRDIVANFETWYNTGLGIGSTLNKQIVLLGNERPKMTATKPKTP